MRKNDDYFIQPMLARSRRRGKVGSLRRMLGIPAAETIPFTWLEVIRNTEIGRRAKNPTKVGFKSVRVTRLLKQRAVAGLNLKRIGQRR